MTEILESNKSNNWTETNRRCVVFLDILGFKELVLRSKHDEVLKIMQYFQPGITGLTDVMNKLMKVDKADNSKIIAQPSQTEIRVVTFSDSIILYSKDHTKEAISKVLLNVSLIMWMAIHYSIPLKGSVAYGLQTADFTKNLHFGIPLIDAYDLQEELLIYGVVLHHSLEKYLQDEKFIDDFIKDDLIKFYPTPMKSGVVNHYLINWAHLFNKKGEYLPLISKMQGLVSGYPRIYVDNTLKFLDNYFEKNK